VGDRLRRIAAVRETGVWTAAVTVVCCGIGAAFADGRGSRIGWIVIGILAFCTGTVDLIRRLATRRSRKTRK